MEINEIVTELYTLRAGLSLISREKDAFDAEVAAAEACKNSAVACARAAANKEIACAREAADSAVQKIDDRISRKKNLSEEREKSLKEAKVALDRVEEDYRKNEKILDDTRYAESSLKSAEIAMPLKLVFGILFILSYVPSAVMVNLLLFASKEFSLSVYLFIPIVAVALIVAVTEIVLAVRCGDLGLIWLGIPHVINVLSVGGLMLMRLLGNESTTDAFFVLIFAMGSDLACIILTSIATHEYKEDDLDDIELYGREVRERRKALEEQPKLKEKLEKERSRYYEKKKEYDDATYFADLENERERTARAEENMYIVECVEINEKFNATQTEEERKFRKVYAASAEVHGKISNGIWDTLVKTYGELLDVRDWGILDLVIWQLETGRAETLKEALQLADRETQTDRIVKTMQSASAAIAQRIDVGFGNLQTQLSSSFYTLAKGLANATGIITRQISRGTDMLIGKIDESAQLTAVFYENQNENMIATNRNLEELFSQASLQTALLEKSNSSSKDLIEAVNKLRKVQSGSV